MDYLLFIVHLEMPLCSSIFVTSPFSLTFGEDVVRFFLPDGVFCDHGLEF